jgi:tetratricopeptide (TPR) repeat protein
MSKWPYFLALAASVAAAADARPPLAPRAGEGQAEELFDKGRRLLLSGRYEQACPVFDASFRLTATVGTLLNRADCYEHTGRLADAWRLFDQAASWAAREQAGKRREVAFTRALSLAARLPWIEVKAEVGAKVSLDGALLGREGEGRRTPINPGSHTLLVEGPGGGSWTRVIEVPSTPGVIGVAPPLGAGDES